MTPRAAIEAVPAAASILSTMTPFLYQTRTLSGVTAISIMRSRFLGSIVRQQSFCRRQYASSTSESARRSRTQERPQRRRMDGLSRKRTTHPTASSGTSGSEIPFEVDSIANSRYQNWGDSAPIDWDDSNGNQHGEGEANGYIEGDVDMYTDENREGTPMDLREPPRDSTITDTERRAFQKIFSDMFGSGHQAVTTQSITKPVSDAGRREASSKLNTIIGSAISRLPKSPEEVEKMMDLYPPALRPAIAKSMGYGTGISDDPFEGEMQEIAELDHDELEALRDPERQRVEALMKAAETDFALWEVMEKEVFPLIPKLRLDKDPKDTKSGSRPGLAKAEEKDTKGEKEVETPIRKARSGKKKQSETPKAFEPFDKYVAETPDGTKISALTFYTPLYPACLLLGLRLLDRSFARPSPLALSILPKIKSLGTISHVLGASTAFYNELISIYFHRYEDFNSIAKMLKEMEESAVDLDDGTLNTIIDILIFQSSVARGQRGKSLKELWTMPKYTHVNFQYWRDRIVKAIKVRQQFNGDAEVPVIGHDR